MKERDKRFGWEIDEIVIISEPVKQPKPKSPKGDKFGDWTIGDVKAYMSQPRHPAGSSNGGQWSGGGSGAGISAKAFTEDEAVFLKDYKEGGYKEMNSFLRAPSRYSKAYAEEMMSQAGFIDSALGKSHLTEDTELFRGVVHPKLHEAIDSMVGRSLEVASFQSTSQDVNVAREFVAYQKGALIFRISAKKGARAVSMDQFETHGNGGEQEVLLGRGGKMTIKSVDRSSDIPVVHMTYEDAQ